MGVAAALAGGVSATANARPAHAAAKPAKPAGAAHTTLKPAPVVAHATGHKIA